jgi:hypothetical protein
LVFDCEGSAVVPSGSLSRLTGKAASFCLCKKTTGVERGFKGLRIVATTLPRLMHRRRARPEHLDAAAIVSKRRTD